MRIIFQFQYGDIMYLHVISYTSFMTLSASNHSFHSGAPRTR